MQPQDNLSLYTPLFFLLCISQFLFSASFNMIIPELPDHLRSMGGESYIGLIIGLFTLTAGLSRPFSGKLTDTIGRMPVQIIGTLVCVFASLLYPFATTIFGFLLLRFFHGFSTGFKPTASTAYLADIVPENRRGEAMGILGVSMNAGASASPPLGSWVAMEYSMDIMFYISSGIALLSVIILMGMKETLKEKQKFKLSILKIGRHEVIEKTAIPPAILAFFIYMSLGVLITICPDQSQFLGLTNKGLFFTSFTVCSVLSRVFAGKLSDKYGRVQVLIWSLCLLFIALILFYWVNSSTSFLLATGFLGFSFGVASPAVFAWTIDRSPEESRGMAMATIYIALEASIGFGAISSAWIYQNNPARFGLTFMFYGFIVVLGILYLYNYKYRNQNKTHA